MIENKEENNQVYQIIQENDVYQIIQENDGVVIIGYTGNLHSLVIPETIGGKIVVGIGEYVFKEHRELMEITIPSGVSQIGAHAFYNCRTLQKVSMPDSICSMGDGTFKNCGRIDTIEINRMNQQMVSLKEILADLNQNVTVTIHNEDGDAVLVFPYFIHHYEENTPARIINQITVGSGLHYRQCVSREDISYSEYDNIFSTEKNIDVTEAAYNIALFRMIYPYRLSQKAYAEYYDYLFQNKEVLMEILLNKEQDEMLLKFLELEILSRSDIEHAIETARSCAAMSGQSVLLQYQNKKFGAKKKTFEF